MAMQYGDIPGVTKQVSRIIMGTSGGAVGDFDEKCRLLDDVFELGVNAIDTAHIYNGGESERVIGQWLRTRGLREQVVIVDKGAHPMQGRNRVTPEDISSDIAESLERLGTDYIDLYLLHRDDPSVEVGPIVECLNAHREAGRIHAFGGSNWTAARIEAANDYAADRGLEPFVASSPNLSLAVPREMPWPGCVSLSGPEAAEERQWYAETGMPVLCWSSLAGGFLTGRFRRDNLDTFTEYFDQLVVKCYCTEENFGRLETAERVGRELGLTLPQVALAWLFRQGLDVYALIAARTPLEMAMNVQALDAIDRVPDFD